MKKLLVAVATVVAVTAVAVGSATGADGPKLVDSGFACNIFDGNGNIVAANGPTEWWVTSNGQGILKCSGSVDPGPGPHPVTQSGFACNTPYGVTTNSFSKVGAAGNSQLTCKASAPADASASSGSYGAAG